MSKADEMRKNVESYQKLHEQDREKYIEDLYSIMKDISLKGGREFEISREKSNSNINWLTAEFFSEVKKMLEEEGFKVEEKIFMDTRERQLIISW